MGLDAYLENYRGLGAIIHFVKILFFPFLFSFVSFVFSLFGWGTPDRALSGCGPPFGGFLVSDLTECSIVPLQVFHSWAFTKYY